MKIVSFLEYISKKITFNITAHVNDYSFTCIKRWIEKFNLQSSKEMMIYPLHFHTQSPVCLQPDPSKFLESWIKKKNPSNMAWHEISNNFKQYCPYMYTI